MIGLVGIAMAGCDTTVTKRYATLADARSDRLFERGWLPDILPPSATNIRASNDLDLNFSEGEFHFAPEDFGDFARKLTPIKPQPREREGVLVLIYTEDRGFWVFSCRAAEGYCEYHMR